MAQQANLKKLSIDGTEFSPSGEWTLQKGGRSRDVRKNLNGTIDWKETPEPDVWSGPISWPGGVTVETLLNAESIRATAELRNGSIEQLTQAVVSNHPELDTDGGELTLELSGNSRTLTD